MDPVYSNEISFKLAGLNAFKQAFLSASPQLLEPIQDLEVLAPEDVVGEIMTDLQSRRSIIQGIEAKGNYQVIKSKTPLSELNRYSTTLRSISHGMASFSSEFAEFSPVPGDLQNKLAAEFANKEDDE